MTVISLTQQALDIINRRGKTAVDRACQEITRYDYSSDIIGNALNFYSETTLSNILPLFPTLIYLSCKAVGGKPEKTTSLATAMMLITASGDIHDDIIDRSTHKLGRKTLFGMYGRNAALLAGDALLARGIALVNECEELSVEQRNVVVGLTAKSMLEMIKAESLETTLWKKEDVKPDEHFEVIRLKGSAAELQCIVGGIVAQADDKARADLARYGRAIGILSTMKEEFVDTENPSELRHRINHEMAPYPVTLALRDKKLKNQTNNKTSELHSLSEVVLKSEAVQGLKRDLADFGRRELAENSLLGNNERAAEAVVLLQALSLEM